MGFSNETYFPLFILRQADTTGSTIENIPLDVHFNQKYSFSNSLKHHLKSIGNSSELTYSLNRIRSCTEYTQSNHSPKFKFNFPFSLSSIHLYTIYLHDTYILTDISPKCILKKTILFTKDQLSKKK